jgi:quercetin dioxygenase-like cupin family protein
VRVRSDLFVKGAEAPREDTDPGVTRQVLSHDPQLMLVRVAFTAGARGYLHSHPHRQISYVETGRFEASVDGQTMVLGPGDTFMAPPGAPHGVVALEAGSLIDVFTPRREDFLGSSEP